MAILAIALGTMSISEAGEFTPEGIGAIDAATAVLEVQKALNGAESDRVIYTDKIKLLGLVAASKTMTANGINCRGALDFFAMWDADTRPVLAAEPVGTPEAVDDLALDSSIDFDDSEADRACE